MLFFCSSQFLLHHNLYLINLRVLITTKRYGPISQDFFCPVGKKGWTTFPLFTIGFVFHPPFVSHPNFVIHPNLCVLSPFVFNYNLCFVTIFVSSLFVFYYNVFPHNLCFLTIGVLSFLFSFYHNLCFLTIYVQSQLELHHNFCFNR